MPTPNTGSHGQIWLTDPPDGRIGDHGCYYRAARPRPPVRLSLVAANGRHQVLTFNPHTGTAALTELRPPAAATDHREEFCDGVV